jgi:pimeloyl-ACP methyl ester carboxylesterase
VVAPGAGHRVPWESGKWFAGRVTEFLRAEIA